MIYDTHIHSKMSSDSQEEPENDIAYANKNGLGIAFTEHYDADCTAYPNVNLEKYFAEYERYRAEDVLLGIEIGITTRISHNENKNLAAAYPFDYVLGAVHMIDKLDIYEDLCLSGKPSLTNDLYFNYVIKMTEGEIFYDSLAHIDYPHRYLGHGRDDFSFDTNADKYDIIFKNLINSDIPIEINTKRLSDKRARAEMAKVYKRYSALGGRFITIGSDAHTAGNIGENFKAALEITKECGLQPVYYIGRKRVLITNY